MTPDRPSSAARSLLAAATAVVALTAAAPAPAAATAPAPAAATAPAPAGATAPAPAGAPAAPATASAAPRAAVPRATDWPPADLQAYVDSGRYLQDVVAATVPARDWLVARTDQIAADREACRAAGLPFPAPVAPAASRAAAPRVAGGGGAAAAPAWVGGTTLRLTRRGAVGRRLRAAGLRLSTRAPATTDARGALLPVRAAGWRGGAATVTHARTLRLRTGDRRATLGGLTVGVRGRAVALQARIGGRTVLLATGTARGAVADRGAGLVRVPATRVRLTAAGAAALRRALGLRALPAGPLGTVAVRATTAAGRGAAAAPGAPPATPAAPAAGPALPATPPTAASCAAVPSRPAIVLDIDETALSNYLGTFGDPEGGDLGYAAVSVFGQGTAMPPIFDLYREARRRGVAVIFITARPGIIRPSTEGNLRRVGYDAWDGLTFKNDLTSAKDVHKTAERRKVEAAGYRIILNVGDQQTDIDGGVAERAFKLPNPFY
ncbi:HAD family acid phosphatase [Patulibacter sp. SYSU D01012]|uniref:HAD family acid phosphatase n=1 Tax=Patulibacter sp. SYSU D01012 TaxID=2817381 RepID=UPI001B301D9F|nr:HAD family acid phosphatase [Patulibacter sp. SYSU D01012]